MKRRRRPFRALARALDRALLGPVMSIAAIVLERRVVGAIKKKPPPSLSDGEAGRSQAQG